MYNNNRGVYMKKIYKESLLKSILITTTITLAIASVLILLHTCLATKANQKYLGQVNNCIRNDIGCEKEWTEPNAEEDSIPDEQWITDYKKLKEKYSNEYQVSSYWTRKTHYECSLIWFEFYRKLVLSNIALGIVIGIILHFVFKKEKTKKKKS